MLTLSPIPRPLSVLLEKMYHTSRRILAGHAVRTNNVRDTTRGRAVIQECLGHCVPKCYSFIKTLGAETGIQIPEPHLKRGDESSFGNMLGCATGVGSHSLMPRVGIRHCLLTMAFQTARAFTQAGFQSNTCAIVVTFFLHIYRSVARLLSPESWIEALIIWRVLWKLPFSAATPRHGCT